MTNVLKIDGAEYSKNVNVVSDLLKRRVLDMVITTHESKGPNADGQKIDGLVLMSRFAVQNNQALMVACGDQKSSQFSLGYEINSVPHYQSEFRPARIVEAGQDAWGQDTIDMVAFPASQLAAFGYDMSEFTYADSCVLKKSTAPTVEFSRAAVLHEVGSRAHFAETLASSEEGQEVLSVVEAQLGPKDAKAIKEIFKLCDQYGMSITQMLPLIQHAVAVHAQGVDRKALLVQTLDTLG